MLVTQVDRDSYPVVSCSVEEGVSMNLALAAAAGIDIFADILQAKGHMALPDLRDVGA